ncbi:MAG: UDP-N-acetylmuramoyl-tripeptide--D-alanyl-D-alanine ligase [Candidatus Pacebacteria bacterium]|nr:UDP-N-acetylmuramoyl-tripeptide--D-alanyl-D-alanine ligase [Candidatus Paceibacterota bacterium]
MFSIEPWMPVAVGLSVLFFWLLKEAKSFLFWTYLWQLKDYHIGRFLSHFDTYNGKKILSNPVSYLKYLIFLVLLLLLGSSTLDYSQSLSGFLSKYSIYFVGAVPLLFLIYFFEGLIALWGMLRRRIKAPKMTAKVSFILPVIFIPLGVITAVFARLFLNDYFNPTKWMSFDLIPFASGILAFDILTPLVVSLMVLLLQPITVFFKWRTINKAKKKREALENLLVVGITGSYGKSSTKEFLKFLLSEDFKVVSTERNENSEMGISRCILENVKEEHEIFICEMGAYNRGGIKLLCDIAKPKIGILTGINSQHFSTFGSQKDIVKGKFELIDSLPSEGLAVLNWDNEFIKENFKSSVASIKYSAIEKQDVWAEDIRGGREGISFKVCFRSGESFVANMKINGVHNVPNLLSAVSVARKLGMETESIVKRLEEMDYSIGGMRLKRLDGLDVIDAAYSSNPDGIISHLDYLKNWEGKKIIVMPCLIELGSEGKRVHREIGKKIGEVCDLAIITSMDYFREMKKSSGMKDMVSMNNGEKILNKIRSFAKEGDVVLIESRVPQKLIDKLLR